MPPIGVMEIVHSLEIGGMERVVLNLVKHLDRERFRPLVVCIACLGDFAPLASELGVPVICLDKPPGVSLKAPINLAGLIKSENVRILHLHNSGPLFTGTLAGLLARAPVRVYTDHARKFPDRRRVMMTEAILLKLIDRVVAVSEETRKNLIKYLHASPDKVTVVPNGVSRPQPVSQQERAALRAKFRIPENAPLVSTVARLEPQKAIDRLIEAAVLVRRRVPDAHFLVAGGGSMFDELTAKVRVVQLENNFHLAGWRSDVAAVLATGDLFVLSSDWEGLPMTILEALALERPVVCPDVGDVGRAVIDGHNGRLTPPGDIPALAEAIGDLLLNPDAAREMGRRGSELFGDQFGAARMTRNYEKIFEEVLCRKH